MDTEQVYPSLYDFAIAMSGAEQVEDDEYAYLWALRQVRRMDGWQDDQGRVILPAVTPTEDAKINQEE